MWTELIDFVTLTKHHLNIVLNKFRLNYTRAEKPAGGQWEASGGSGERRRVSEEAAGVSKTKGNIYFVSDKSYTKYREK